MKKLFSVLTIIFLANIFMTMPSNSEELSSNEETIILAGGCFWCVESDFDKLPAVLSTTSGYTGGHLENPTYGQVSHGGTGYYESVKITFDSKQLSYATLFDYFFQHIDPLDDKGQFCDKGDQYRSAIFVANKNQEREALASKKRAEEKLGQNIVTQILPAATFYDAEDYHQDYHNKNPVRYKLYRFNCGRDKRVNDVWSK